jgi:2-methylcitrate dehydratase PrpD
MSVTAGVAEFISHAGLSNVPSSVCHLAKRSIVDGIGLAIAGSRAQGSRLLREHVASAGCSGEASVLGTALTAPNRFAAFLNGAAIHADDYDDTQLAVSPDRVYGLLTHPTAPVLPAVLAIAETDQRSGADLLLSYLVGVEVATKVSESIKPRHYEEGFHSTATAGAIGAAAGVAKLLALDAEKTAVALAIAASQAGGLRENFGTMTKPFHAGRAAESGVIAGDLARRGFTAAPNILEAPRGFFRAAGGGYDPDLIDGQLGRPWTFESPGVSIKPHPSGSLTHPAMWAMAQLISEHGIVAGRVQAVRVGTNRHMPNALIHHRPQTELEAKFSMEFCMAILLLDGRAGLSEFTDAVVRRPDVQEMVSRISLEVDSEAEAAGSHTMTSIVSVQMDDGRRLTARAQYGKGSPENPMSDDELVRKFLECAAWGGLAEESAIELSKRLLAVEDEPNVAGVIRSAHPQEVQ